MNSLESMFEWLLATTLRASVLAVAILGVQMLLRRWLPPQWRHALWMPLLLVLALPVLPEVPFGIMPKKAPLTAEANPAPVVVAAESALPTMAEPAATAAAQATTAKLNPWAMTWLAGSVLMLGIGIASYQRNIRRIKRASVPMDDALRQSLASAAREVGLGNKTRVIVSTAVDSPAVTGLLRPSLLLPANFPAGFSESQARLILLHEFTHLKRLDLPVNWLTCVFQAMHWFNPILWFAFARMRADRESACDAQVLALDKDDRRSDYGHALLKLQSVTPRSGLQLGFVGIFENNSELKTRIREISSHRKSHPAWRAAGLTMIGVLTLFGATKAQERKPRRAPAVPPAAADGPEVTSLTEINFKKLEKLVIPVVKFENTSLEEAIDFVRTKSKELDTAEKDPAKKGMDFVIMKPREGSKAPDPAKARVTLNLKSATVRTVLQEISKQTNLRFSISESGVTFLPADHKDNFRHEPPVEPKAPNGKAGQSGIKIIIPAVELVDVSLTEAVETLNRQAKENAKAEQVFPIVLDPEVDGGVMIPELRLRNVPLSVALEYVCDVTKNVLTGNDKELRITKP